MTTAPLDVRLWHAGPTAHVLCRGELDVSTVSKLENALGVAFQARPRTVIFNGAGITILTSTGIELLITTAARCGVRGINFQTILGSRSWRVVDLLGVRSLVQPHESLDYELPHDVARALRARTRPLRERAPVC